MIRNPRTEHGQMNTQHRRFESAMGDVPQTRPAGTGHAMPTCGGRRHGAQRLPLASMALLCLAVALAFLPFAPLEARYASIVIETQSGAVLHETNADTRNYPASLVKMMTLYLAFEALRNDRLKRDEQLEVSRRAEGMAPSRLGLKSGQTLRVEDAILAVVTKSANDAAVVLAEALGGSEFKFAQLMNGKARELGMARTNFRNATGLPHRRQLSTARDMATLARALLRDFPEHYALFSVTEFHYAQRTYHNHNRLLESYAGTDGIKTGYTRASGFNLAASVQRGDHRLIAVVFGGKTAKSRDRHMVKLLDRAFARIGSATRLASLEGLAAGAAQTPRDSNPTHKAQAASKRSVSMARYGAQVGAYYRYNEAERAANVAARRLPESVDEPYLWIPKVEGRKGSLFLARLVGLTKTGAKEACQHLKAADIDCLAIKVQPPTSLALN